MSETIDNQTTTETAAAPAGLESSTYEIIRNRLLASGKELRSRLDQLNEARKQVFGSIDTVLLSTERITTEHNCTPRDMVAIGNQLLFGYNVHFGLKSEMQPSDVFAQYTFKDGKLTPTPHTVFDTSANSQNSPSADTPVHAASQRTTPSPAGAARRDFGELFKYYKNAVFSKFATRGATLFMVFQVGKTASETKVFKWVMEGSGDNVQLRYVDNRSEHEYRFPPQHDFEWTRTTRDDHHYGDLSLIHI